MRIYGYIIVMAIVTYLIRMIPLTVFQKKITNKYVKSFLYYVPYACLMAMTFPAVFSATGHTISAVLGVGTAILLALWNKGLITVSVVACIVVYVTELLISFM